MTFQGNSYPFKLGIGEVEADGTFGGEIVWDYHGMRSPIRGRADGNHLVFTDSDGDRKDVTLAGAKMEGTDKNGAATFTANRTDGPVPPEFPVGPEWRRQWAVCEGLEKSSLGPRCWRALAVAASEDLACAKLGPQDVAACKRLIAGGRGELARCEADEDCIVEAAVHGAGEAACETLRSAGALRRCLAGVRKKSEPCRDEAIPAVERERCLASLARETKDPKLCEQLQGREECLRSLAPAPTPDGCAQEAPGQSKDACLLQLVGNGEPAARCAEIGDEAMKAACQDAGRQSVGARLPMLR